MDTQAVKMVLERPLLKLQVQKIEKALDDLRWQVGDMKKNGETKARRAVASAEKRVQMFQARVMNAATAHESTFARSEHTKALSDLHFRREELAAVPRNILALEQQVKEKEDKLKESERLTKELRKTSGSSSAQPKLEITRRTQQVKTERLLHKRVAESPLASGDKRNSVSKPIGADTQATCLQVPRTKHGAAESGKVHQKRKLVTEAADEGEALPKKARLAPNTLPNTAPHSTLHSANEASSRKSSESSIDWVSPTSTGVTTPDHTDESEEDYQLRGLINIKQACFANAAIQLLNAALTLDEIRKLRGSDELSSFSYTYQKLRSLFDDCGVQKSSARKEIEKLRNNVAAQGAEKKIPIAPYLGQVLLDMREGISHKSKSANVNPILLQQAFAYGGHQSRRRYGGDTQEDAFEYLMLLVNAVAEEHPFMSQVFETSSTVLERCGECAQEKRAVETRFGHKVQVPDLDPRAANPPGLRRTIEQSMAAGEELCEKSCSQCGKQDKLVTTTAPGDSNKNFLVQLDRALLDLKHFTIKKVMTKFSLQGEDLKLQLGENTFKAKAFIRHDGREADRGHYTALVQHQGIWNKLDDLSCTKATSKDMTDSRTDVSCVVLFQKVEHEPQAKQ